MRELEAIWRRDGLSSTNIRKHVRILSSVLSEAAEDELIAVNPLLNGGRRRRRSKERQADPTHDHPLTREELAALLETALTHRIERKGARRSIRSAPPIPAPLAHTGLRLGEAFALRWQDVDWRGGFLHVRRSYTHGVESATKSGKARKVEMSDRLRAVLRELYRDRFERVIAIDAEAQAALAEDRADRAATALVFPNSAGYLDDHNVRRRIWAPLLVAAGLSHHRLHDLRHTFATLHLQAGSDAAVWVSQQMGTIRSASRCRATCRGRRTTRRATPTGST